MDCTLGRALKTAWIPAHHCSTSPAWPGLAENRNGTGHFWEQTAENRNGTGHFQEQQTGGHFLREQTGGQCRTQTLTMKPNFDFFVAASSRSHTLSLFPAPGTVSAQLSDISSYRTVSNSQRDCSAHSSSNAANQTVSGTSNHKLIMSVVSFGSDNVSWLPKQLELRRLTAFCALGRRCSVCLG